MSGGLTEAKSLRRLTQAFRMAALCCSLGSVMWRVGPPKASILFPAGAFQKGLFLSFSKARQRSHEGFSAMARQLKPWLLSAATRQESTRIPRPPVSGIGVAFFIGFAQKPTH